MSPERRSTPPPRPGWTSSPRACAPNSPGRTSGSAWSCRGWSTRPSSPAAAGRTGVPGHGRCPRTGSPPPSPPPSRGAAPTCTSRAGCGCRSPYAGRHRASTGAWTAVSADAPDACGHHVRPAASAGASRWRPAAAQAWVADQRAGRHPRLLRLRQRHAGGWSPPADRTRCASAAAGRYRPSRRCRRRCGGPAPAAAAGRRRTSAGARSASNRSRAASRSGGSVKPLSGSRSSVHPEPVEVLGRQVDAPVLPVLPHVAQDVGQLQRHAQRVGQAGGPVEPSAQSPRESHRSSRHAAAVPEQVAEGLVGSSCTSRSGVDQFVEGLRGIGMCRTASASAIVTAVRPVRGAGRAGGADTTANHGLLGPASRRRRFVDAAGRGVIAERLALRRGAPDPVREVGRLHPRRWIRMAYASSRSTLIAAPADRGPAHRWRRGGWRGGRPAQRIVIGAGSASSVARIPPAVPRPRPAPRAARRSAAAASSSTSHCASVRTGTRPGPRRRGEVGLGGPRGGQLLPRQVRCRTAVVLADVLDARRSARSCRSGPDQRSTHVGLPRSPPRKLADGDSHRARGRREQLGEGLVPGRPARRPSSPRSAAQRLHRPPRSTTVGPVRAAPSRVDQPAARRGRAVSASKASSAARRSMPGRAARRRGRST